jgi:hypothetical protein
MSLSNACWEGYEAIGMKKKGKRMVPNCVPIKGQGVKPKFFYINPKEELLGKGVGSSKPKIYPTTSPDEITRLVYANRPPLVLRPANREPVPDPKAVQSAKYEIAMRKLKKKFENV